MSSAAIKRLAREYKALQAESPPHITARPESDNIHDLPDDTPYVNGIYHGRLDFPRDYPFAAPKIQMLTPNGRFKCNFPLCFSMSNYHPESWNPAWSVSTILTAFLSFFLDPADPATTGSILTTTEEKREHALASRRITQERTIFRRLFPQFSDTTFSRPLTHNGSKKNR